MSDRDDAWAAGLFEGEGCFTWRNQSPTRRYPSAAMKLTDEDVIRRFARIVGVGRVTGPRIREGRKPIWEWRAFGAAAMSTLDEVIGSFLGERRRARLDEMLTFVPCAPCGQDRFTPEGWAVVRRVVRENGQRSAGAANGRAKLDVAAVAAIRSAAGITRTELARRHGVSRRQIGRVLDGAAWA